MSIETPCNVTILLAVIRFTSSKNMFSSMNYCVDTHAVVFAVALMIVIIVVRHISEVVRNFVIAAQIVGPFEVPKVEAAKVKLSCTALLLKSMHNIVHVRTAWFCSHLSPILALKGKPERSV